jgi:hypothetical protein
VAVQAGAGPVVAHRGARVGVPGGDLDIPEVHAGIKHGGHKGAAEHVAVDLCPQAGGLGQAAQAGAQCLQTRRHEIPVPTWHTGS